MNIIPLSSYNPLCTNCIKCTNCIISVEDTKKMHFIYKTIQSGYIVGPENINDNKYHFKKVNENSSDKSIKRSVSF